MAKKSLPDVIRKIGTWGIVLWVATYTNRWESYRIFFFLELSVIFTNAYIISVGGNNSYRKKVSGNCCRRWKNVGKFVVGGKNVGEIVVGKKNVGEKISVKVLSGRKVVEGKKVVGNSILLTGRVKWLNSRNVRFAYPRKNLSLIHIWRCRRSTLCRSRWSPYH